VSKQAPKQSFRMRDAVGSDVDNLSVSDRRAESVAIALTQRFGVPAENLTTHGIRCSVPEGAYASG
jgi:outer membrane protein OmpA-like peptidoglycan-associated protein